MCLLHQGEAGCVTEATGRFELSCFDVLLFKILSESKQPHSKLDFGALFFQQKASVATFFTPVGVFRGKKETNQRKAILAMILEKHLKAWLNINVYLRHSSYV